MLRMAALSPVLNGESTSPSLGQDRIDAEALKLYQSLTAPFPQKIIYSIFLGGKVHQQKK